MSETQNVGLSGENVAAVYRAQVSEAEPENRAASGSEAVSAAEEDSSVCNAQQENIRSWENLGVRKEVAESLVGNGFMRPSLVQEKSIPHAILGKDLLVKAWNGTGKTASFMVPILNRIDVSKNLQAIIIVPIRELALQISKMFITLGSPLGIRTMPAIGGKNLVEDVMRMSSGVHIIVGTPGRVDDLLMKDLCSIEKSLTLVLDEADKVLDTLFYVSMSKIFRKLPSSRQTLLYSATFPRSIEGFVSANMLSPLKISVNDRNFRNVREYFVGITRETKLVCLKTLLSACRIEQCVIFCNSIRSVEFLAEKITEMGMSAYFIHSSMDHDERNIVYHNFAKGKCRIMVSTDLTTRGIDVQNVNVVINFDLPDSSESYQHRIGRAGRFGREACAISMITSEEKSLLIAYAASCGSSVLPVSDSSFKRHCKD